MDINFDLIITIIGIIIAYKIYTTKIQIFFKYLLIIFVLYFTLPHIGIIFSNMGYQFGNDGIISKTFIFLGDLFTYFK